MPLSSPSFIARTVASTCLLATLGACMNLGPASVQAGRLSYAEAISTTEEQQILLALVRNRHDQHGSMLAVNSVTANIRIAASGSMQFGFGDNDDYSGNLVPLGAGLSYEENPTISYAPVSGEKYLRSVMSPLPLSRFALLAGNLAEPEYIYRSLLERVNGLKNPGLSRPGRLDNDFDRLVGALSRLDAANSLKWLARSDYSAELLLERNDASSTRLVADVLQLLAVDDPAPGSERVVLPVTFGFDGPGDEAVQVYTRSVWELVELLSATIELPTAAGDSARPATAPGPRILHAAQAPDDAAVAVPFQDGWFYIASGDRDSKRVFRLLVSLWHGAMSGSTPSSPPVLTVPVSR